MTQGVQRGEAPELVLSEVEGAVRRRRMGVSPRLGSAQTDVPQAMNPVGLCMPPRCGCRGGAPAEGMGVSPRIFPLPLPGKEGRDRGMVVRLRRI
jgi:hypothetical protein